MNIPEKWDPKLYDPENATLHEFVKTHRLRLKKDECGDLNVFGKRGDIYEHSPGVLAMTILHMKTPRYWNRIRLLAIAAQMKISQNGDTEGTALFDPGNLEQAKFAIEAIRASRKRLLSVERLETLRRAGAKTQFTGAKTTNPE